VRRLLVLFASVLIVGSAPLEHRSPWAAVAEPLFVRVDTQALPHPDVRRLAIDAFGFLWIGTPGGLARFDGYRFRTFVPNPNDPTALPDGWIRAMMPDPHGGLWIGTESSGLVRYDARTETFRTWRPVPRGSGGPRSTIVSALATAPDGSLWVGGDGGLDRFDERTGSFAHVALVPGPRQPTVLSFLYDREGVLWVGTTAGIFTSSGAGFRRFAVPGIRSAGDIWNLYEDGEGRLWVSGNGPLAIVGRSRKRVMHLRESRNDPSAISPEHTGVIETTPGTIWIGEGSGGISVVDTRTWRVHRIAPDRDNRNGLSEGQVQQFLRDPSGLIWIAKGTGGLALFNPAGRGLFELSDTRARLRLGDEGPTALAALGPDRFAAGGLGWLSWISANAPPVATDVGLRTILTIAPVSDGTVLLGGPGLCRVGVDALLVRCPAGPPQVGRERVDAILDDGRRLWIGTRAGLVVADSQTKRVRIYRGGRSPNALTNRWVTALLHDREGGTWVGTQAGLNRIAPDGRVTRFRFDPKDPRSLSPGVVDALLQDRRGRIWAGTIGGQLNVLARGADGRMHIRRIGRADGLPHENVDGLAQDGRGRIWASTPRGIAMFEPDSFRARGFGPIDGVSDGAYHAGSVAQAGDTIFFGSFDGVTVVAPGAVSPWNYSPPLVVTALTVGKRSVPAWLANAGQAPLALPAGEHDLSVEFAALDYSDPAVLRYEYRLDGYEGGWNTVDAEHRVATYTNLPPGDYTLLVRATNRLGVWSDRTLAIRLHAIPAWYETWWFRALLLLALLALAYALHQARTAFLRRRQHELEATVDERTRELSQANASLKQAYAVLEEMSLSDPLTGLRNRRFLTQSIGDEVAFARRRYQDWLQGGGADLPADADAIFFMVDIDHFKAVNDEYGHAAGDRVLRQMRERLEQVFRETDFLVRWGGEEFLAVARRSRRADAPELAERLRLAVASKPFELDGGKTIVKTASVGFASLPFIPEAPDALGWLTVIELADEALYMAKREGRNRWYGVAASQETAALVERSPRISAEELVRKGAVEIVAAPPAKPLHEAASRESAEDTVAG